MRSKINFLAGPQESLLATVRRRKLALFRHFTRHDSLSGTILKDTLEGGWHRGRQRKCWMDNVREWTSLPIPELLTMANCRKQWKRLSAESSFVFPPTAKSVTGLNCVEPQQYSLVIITHLLRKWPQIYWEFHQNYRSVPRDLDLNLAWSIMTSWRKTKTRPLWLIFVRNRKEDTKLSIS